MVTELLASKTPVVGFTQYFLGAVVFTLKHTRFSVLLDITIVAVDGSLKGPAKPRFVYIAIR